MHKNKGVTLPELMVTVMILGALSGMAMPFYFKMAEQGRANEAKANLQVIQMGESAYKLKNGGRYWVPGNTDIATINSVLGLDLSATYYTDNIKITGNGTTFQASMERGPAAGGANSTWTVSAAPLGDPWEWDGVIPPQPPPANCPRGQTCN